MIKPVLYQIDKSLESEHFKNLELSIQLMLDGFSFSILNSDLNKIVAIVSYDFTDIQHPLQLLEKIKKIYAENSLLKMTFQNINVSHINQVSTLVPTPLFDDDKLDSYLGLNHKILENEYLAYDIIEQVDLANIYSPYTEINDYIFENYGEFIYKHFSSVLIETFIDKHKENTLKMFVHVQNKQFEVIVIDNKKLLLYNSFLYQNEEDFVYFILFIAEQLKINPEEFALELYGEIEANSELFKLLYKYVRNVSFGSRTDNKLYSHELDKINEHRYLVLFNQ
ncbi:MAG: DUF3822 family protein [Flavobacteriales bacterium]|nr:DUF3822 family protein [Flavobacteriales bacterium]